MPVDQRPSTVHSVKPKDWVLNEDCMEEYPWRALKNGLAVASCSRWWNECYRLHFEHSISKSYLSTFHISLITLVFFSLKTAWWGTVIFLSAASICSQFGGAYLGEDKSLSCFTQVFYGLHFRNTYKTFMRNVPVYLNFPQLYPEMISFYLKQKQTHSIEKQTTWAHWHPSHSRDYEQGFIVTAKTAGF